MNIGSFLMNRNRIYRGTAQRSGSYGDLFYDPDFCYAVRFSYICDILVSRSESIAVAAAR